MTFTGGEHVRLKPTKENKYPSIGIVVGIKDQVVEVEYRRRIGEHITKRHSLGAVEEMCKEHVYRSTFDSYSECGRKAKEDHLCGMHLGAKKRRDNEQQKRKERERLAKEYRDETALLTQHLNEQIDKRIHRETSAPSLSVLNAREGTVSIKLDELLDLIRNA